ncbi:MAG: RNA-binding protein [Curvibacter sp.]|nr:RNA-binding protein [Curvibacter sp.]
MNDPIRLSKQVAEQAACSRREAELLIEGGWVQVNGQTVEEPQHRIRPDSDVVTVSPQARPESVPPATLLWHRPDAASPCDAGLLRATPPANPYAVRVLGRHFNHQEPIAGLQGLATGLVVFTQDGRMRRRLLEDEADLEQEFMVELPGQLTDEAIGQLTARLQQARLWPQVPVVGKLSLNARGPQGTRLRFALKASSPAAVLRLCESAGLRPQALRRTRLGRVALAGLAPGAWRFLEPQERF